MILSRHGVFLVYLALALAWNAWAARRGWERRLLVSWVAVLVVVLARDRAVLAAPAWLAAPGVGWLFPAAFLLTLVQNVAAIRERGARLTDIPVVLANAGLLLCVSVAASALGSSPPGPSGAVLLADHAFLQNLLGGGHLTGLSTLSWHLPLLVARDEARSLGGLVLRVLPASVAGFVVAMLAGFHATAEAGVASFAGEPRLDGWRDGLQVGVWMRADAAHEPWPPGSLDAWVLPADHDGAGLPEPTRPLVLALAAPRSWALSRPDDAAALETFVAGAERLARALRPDVLLPFPDPDLEGLTVVGLHRPDAWRALFSDVATRVRRASPRTRLALRLADTQAYSRDLFAAVADLVDIAGPRLLPGYRGPVHAIERLAVWERWRRERDDPPALWILAAGLSPLAFGEDAQARFLEGTLARAVDDASVEAVLVDGWRDLGRTVGLVDARGRERLALARLRPWLQRR